MFCTHKRLPDNSFFNAPNVIMNIIQIIVLFITVFNCRCFLFSPSHNAPLPFYVSYMFSFHRIIQRQSTYFNNVFFIQMIFLYLLFLKTKVQLIHLITKHRFPLLASWYIRLKNAFITYCQNKAPISVLSLVS